MAEIHLVYAGFEFGGREDCSIFYETPEAYLTEAEAIAREEELKAEFPKSPNNGYTYRISVEIGAKTISAED